MDGAESPIIQVIDLIARYGEETILQEVSLDVQPGERLVVLGGSGCGKSTLLRHIIGLDQPAGGRVIIDGVDITDCSPKLFQQTLRKLGVLFQGSALLGSMTLAQNVALPILEHVSLPRAFLEDIVRMKLRLVGLDGFQGYYPAEMSGGMKKRAGLARALALNPHILLLDEPSAGLDPITAAQIDELILNINQTLGTTILIVTHELSSIFTVAQRAVMLDKSTRGIIAQGAPRDLQRHSDNPFVKQFFNRQPHADA